MHSRKKLCLLKKLPKTVNESVFITIAANHMMTTSAYFCINKINKFAFISGK
jgi:hypothetical protein